MASIWIFALAGLLSMAGTYLMLHLSPRIGLIDHPDARKVHVHPTARGGGVAIWLAFVIAVLLLGIPATDPRFATLLGLSLGIVALGFLDDVRPLAWQLRIGVQFCLAIVWVATDPEGRNLAWQAVAVLWIVTMVNAFNMLDNMDALSGGVAWIAATMFALVACCGGDGDGLPTASFTYQVALAGSLTGFLFWNWPPARIFMGDAGSTFLGFFLGIRSLEDLPTSTPVWRSWLIPLMILAVPCYDLATVVTLRLWQGRSPFHADKQHLSHRLVALGLSSPSAVRVIYLLALVSGLAGVLMLQANGTQAWLLLGLVASLWLAVAGVECLRHFTRRDKANLKQAE